MTTVLHLYDHRTPAAALSTLDALRRRQTDSLIARVGGRTRPDLPEPDIIVRRQWLLPLTAAPEIKRVVAARDIDAIHCWSPTVAEAAAATGRPTVLSVFRPPTSGHTRAIRAAARAGSHIAACSATLADTLLGQGVRPGRLHVVAPAAGPINRTGAAGAATRRRMGIGTDACVLITTPQHRRDRGPYRTVWALGILHHAGLTIHAIIPGTRSATAAARRFAADTHMAPWVHFPGPVDPADAHALWAAADIAVLYDDDGFGLSAAAMAVAAGAPIAATAAGELAASLRDGETALLVPPGTPRRLCTAIWRLHENPGLAAQLVAGADEALAELGDVDRMVGRFEDLCTASGPTPQHPLT